MHLAAGEELLTLLCSIRLSAAVSTDTKTETTSADTEKGKQEDTPEESNAGKLHVDNTLPLSTANMFAKQLRERVSVMTASSTFLAQQSKWAYDVPAPPIQLPLGPDTQLSTPSIVTVNSMWTKPDVESCAAIQTQCIKRISALRSKLSTSSSVDIDKYQIYSDDCSCESPLSITEFKVVKADAQYGIESSKKKPGGNASMATFFNPYENKTTMVREPAIVGEERQASISFKSSLCVTIPVTSCELVFSEQVNEFVKTTPVSFKIPPGSNSFEVSFSYVISNEAFNTHEDFDIVGTRVTYFGRSAYIPLSESSQADQDQRPTQTTVVELKKHLSCLQMQALPCQPRLNVRFADCGAAVERLTAVVSSGSLYTSQTFIISSFGDTDMAVDIEQLEVHVSGFPGLNQCLFELNSTRTNKNSSNDDDYLDQHLSSGQIPFNMRLKADHLTMESVNDRGRPRSSTQGQSIVFQIATGFDNIPTSTSLRLRFRYCGRPMETNELWRNYDVELLVNRVDGPSITALSFRDFAGDTGLRALEYRFNQDEAERDTTMENPNPLVSFNETETAGALTKYFGTFKSGSRTDNHVFVLVSVLNGSSAVRIAKDSSALGDIEMNPIQAVEAEPHARLDVPMIIPRVDQKAVLQSVLETITSSTTLTWRAIRGDFGCLHGKIRLSSRPLAEMISRNPLIITKMTKPPFVINCSVGAKPVCTTPMQLEVGGLAVEVCISAQVSEWVSKSSLDKRFVVSTNLVCRKVGDEYSASRGFHWVGMVRRKHSIGTDGLNHSASLVFSGEGSYVVSFFTELQRINNGTIEEMWKAPFEQKIVVQCSKQ